MFVMLNPVGQFPCAADMHERKASVHEIRRAVPCPEKLDEKVVHVEQQADGHTHTPLWEDTDEDTLSELLSAYSTEEVLGVAGLAASVRYRRRNLYECLKLMLWRCRT